MKRLRSAIEYVLQSLQAFRSAVSATDSLCHKFTRLVYTLTHTHMHTHSRCDENIRSASGWMNRSFPILSPTVPGPQPCNFSVMYNLELFH